MHRSAPVPCVPRRRKLRRDRSALTRSVQLADLPDLVRLQVPPFHPALRRNTPYLRFLFRLRRRRWWLEQRVAAGAAVIAACGRL